MVKRTIAFFLAVFAGLFFDLTIPPRKVLAKFLANKVWGAELPKEEVDEEAEPQVERACDEQCEERIGELRTKQRQITDLSFMLSTQPLPHAWHHEMPLSERKPVRSGKDITKNPPRRLSPIQAAEAIMAVIAKLPEPPSLYEMTEEEAIIWDDIMQRRSGALLVLEGRHPGYPSLSVMFLKKSKHRRTK